MRMLDMLFRHPDAVADHQTELRRLRRLSDDETKEASRKFFDALFAGALDDINRPPPDRRQ